MNLFSPFIVFNLKNSGEEIPEELFKKTQQNASSLTYRMHKETEDK